MSDLPLPIIHVFSSFAPLFSFPVYSNALLLFVGHLLSKGRRTVTDLLRQLNLSKIKNFSKFHWFFSCARWSAIHGSKILLSSLSSLCPGEITLSFDSTVERRRGEKIKSLGRHRDAARSTKGNKILTIGLNWLICAIHIKFPWTNRAWACPFFSLLMPPKTPLRSSKNKNDLNKKGRHKTLNDWASQCIRIFSKWIGKLCRINLVADNAFATYQLANTCIDCGVSLISRIRLDARTFAFPEKNKRGRPKRTGKRLPTFEELSKEPSGEWRETDVKWYGGETKKVSIRSGNCLWAAYGIRPVPIRWVLVEMGGQVIALFSTNLEQKEERIIELFVERWQIEVTFEEVRRHLGAETQRQWSDKAIDRTTPCIMASYSIINLMAAEMIKERNEEIPVEETSWYKKKMACFSDVLSYLKLAVLKSQYFSQVGRKSEREKNQLRELLSLLAAA